MRSINLFTLVYTYFSLVGFSSSTNLSEGDSLHTESISVIQVLAKDPNFSTTIKFFQKSRLIPYINRQVNLTLFTLDNKAWKNELGEDAYQSILEEPEVDIEYELGLEEEHFEVEDTKELQVPVFGKWTIPQMQGIVKYMLFQQRFTKEELLEAAKNSIQVQSYMNFNSSLGLNRGQFVTISGSTSSIPWSPNNVYIGGSKLLSGDIAADNGVIHVLEKTISPPSHILDVLEEIHSKDVVKISKVLDLIKSTTTFEADLKAPKPHTLFVFQDDQLKNFFKPVELSYLEHPEALKDRSDFLAANLINLKDQIPLYTFELNHTQQLRLPAWNGQTLVIERNNKEGKWLLNGIHIKVKNYFASNGVIHVLDGVNTSEKLEFDGFKYMIGLGASKFGSIMKAKSLINYVMDPITQHTILVTPDSAINALDLPPPDSEDLIGLMKYHVVLGNHSSDTLKSTPLINTVIIEKALNGTNQIIKVTTNQNSNSITFNNQATMIKEEVTFGKATFITISNLLTAPVDVLSLISRDSSLSSFSQLLRASDMEDELKGLSAITLFAPTNDAFAADGQQLLMDYLLLESSKPILKQFIQYCIGKVPFYTPNLKDSKPALLETFMGSESLALSKNSEQDIILQVRAGAKHYDITPEISESDIFIKSGVVHKTNSLLPPDTTNTKVTLRRLLSGSKTTIFQGLLETAGMSKLLDESNSYPRTVIVPSDEAWSNVNLTRLNEDKLFLKMILYLHFLNDPAPPRLDSLSKTTLISTMSYALSALQIVFSPHTTHTGPPDSEKVLKNVVLRTSQAPSLLFNWYAHIYKSGQALDGSLVIIDSPIYLDHFPGPGLSWYTVLVIIVLGLSVIAGGIFAYVKWYKPRQMGYEPIAD